MKKQEGFIAFTYKGLVFVPDTKESRQALKDRRDIVLVSKEEWLRLEMFAVMKTKYDASKIKDYDRIN